VSPRSSLRTAPRSVAAKSVPSGETTRSWAGGAAGSGCQATLSSALRKIALPLPSSRKWT